MPKTIHHPRVAWDAARVFVAASHTDELFTWLSHEIGMLLGPACEQKLIEGRERVLYPPTDNAELVEAGVWRARLEDALRARPEAAEPLWTLATTVSAHLRQLSPA